MHEKGNFKTVGKLWVFVLVLASSPPVWRQTSQRQSAFPVWAPGYRGAEQT